MQKVSNKIKVVGFIMTCFMVFYHCGDYDNSLAMNNIDSWFNTEFNHLFHHMGAIVMAWFFTVTGFLLMYGLKISNYTQKIKRRCFSLLIPYVLWQILTAIHHIVVFHSRYSMKEFFYQIFTFVMWPYDGALWYVYAVFLLAILSPILLIIFTNNRNVGFIILITIISILQYRENIANPIFQKVIDYGYIPQILAYLPEFLIGAFYGRFFDELNNADSLKYALLFLFTSRLLYFVDFGSMALVILPILGIYLIPNITKYNNLNIYKLTFLLYALHQIIIMDLQSHILNVLRLVLHSATFINLLNRIVILIIDIILSAIIYIVLKKICPLFLKLLTGGRI